VNLTTRPAKEERENRKGKARKEETGKEAKGKGLVRSESHLLSSYCVLFPRSRKEGEKPVEKKKNWVA